MTDEIRQLIATDKTEKAIDFLLNIIKERDKEMFNQILLLHSRFSSWRVRERLGISDGRAECNKINLALLEIISEIELLEENETINIEDNYVPKLKFEFQSKFEILANKMEISLFLEEVDFRVKNNLLPHYEFEISEQKIVEKELEKINNMTSDNVEYRRKILTLKQAKELFRDLQLDIGARLKLLYQIPYITFDFDEFAEILIECIYHIFEDNTIFNIDTFKFERITIKNRKLPESRIGTFGIDLVNHHESTEFYCNVNVEESVLKQLWANCVERSGVGYHQFLNSMLMFDLRVFNLDKEIKNKKIIPAFVEKIVYPLSRERKLNEEFIDLNKKENPIDNPAFSFSIADYKIGLH